MKIAVYVGSFNPVHKSHIKVVNLVLKNYVDKVIIVPTLAYWDKKNLIDIKDRINMLKFYENEKIIIDTKNNKCEYTYQVLTKFDKWKNIDEILKYRIIVVKRNNIDACVYDKYSKYNFIVTNKVDSEDVSSTMVRNMILNKDKDILKYIDMKVYKYIKRNNLYVN